ncbi:Hypothetical predicted protein [Paramuricea clavata]|uniref:Uncharacterized protein n=1 Tax=Paramuricea clavata TaxID=317549 RepID=A0A6S7FY04_PARCT|nr:Hypothetical predicted protein [Paramuricea clavata]
MVVRFYKKLNNLSTADFIAYKATPRRGKLYEIERVVAKKMRKGKTAVVQSVDMLVQYHIGNFRLYIWSSGQDTTPFLEPECNLNLLALRAYMDPSPSSEIVSRSVDALHNAILDNLGSRSTLPTVIIFQHDVFHFLFKNMGTASENKNHTLLEKEDFVRCAFPERLGYFNRQAR